MRETNFIDQNKGKWQQFEEVLDQSGHAAEDLSDLFVQVTDDLSFSRTFYPNRSVRVYLNDLAQRAFQSIYRGRVRPWQRFARFWLEELPQLVYEARRDFLIAALVFALAFGIGVLSSSMDPEFAEVVLGDSYVRMTEENIASGDPMAVYKQRGMFGMSVGITANNLFVSFLTFIMGIFFGIGTLAILIRNAVMVGAFQYFFIERGLFWESFLTIWTHGTLEISAIIIAGAAGLTMGRGPAFPGTYTRLQAFQRSARRGLKIMIGIAPIIVLAGFIEGFLTRNTETPDILRGFFIAVCLAFILVYFVWYPRMRARLGFPSRFHERELPPTRPLTLQLEAIRGNGEIFTDIFSYFRKYAGTIVGAAALASLVFCLTVFSVSQVAPSELFVFPSELFGSLRTIDQFVVTPRLRWLPLLNIVLWVGFSVTILRPLHREASSGKKSSWPMMAARVMPGILVCQLLLLSNDWYTALLFVMAAPFPLLFIFVAQHEGLGPGQGLVRTFDLIRQGYGRGVSLLLTLVLIGMLLYGFGDSLLVWSHVELISWVIQLSEEQLPEVSTILITALTIFSLFLIGALLLIGFGLLYFTLLEIREARVLRARIQRIGHHAQVRGLDREQAVTSEGYTSPTQTE